MRSYIIYINHTLSYNADLFIEWWINIITIFKSVFSKFDRTILFLNLQYMYLIELLKKSQACQKKVKSLTTELKSA